MGVPPGGLTARERELVARAAGPGEDAAARVEALHALFATGMAGYLASRFGALDVEALAGEAWVRAMGAISRYADDAGDPVERRHARLRSWAYGIAHNLALDAARKAWLRRGWRVPVDRDGEVDGAEAPGADDALAEREGMRRVTGAIRLVRRDDPVAGEVLAMLAEGWSYARIGARLGVRRRRVGERVREARELLRAALEAVDGGPVDPGTGS